MTTLPSFADPLWLAALALLPGVAWLHHRARRHGALLASRLPASRSSSWRLHLPFYLRLAALAAILIALARPQLGYAWEESTTAGIDIQIALDVSGSMAAKDLQPRDRLEVAKRVARDFIRHRTGDRIGLTTFAGTALTRAPLTSDHAMLDEITASLTPSLDADGTAIGVALANAAGRLRAGQAKSKIVILVTDGINNAGEIDPLSAAAVAQGLGIRVYTVGVGRHGTALLPVRTRDPLTGRTFVREVEAQVEVDEDLLRAISARTGGRSYRATDAGALANVFADIDRLERTEMKTRRHVRYREGFQPLAWTALALLLTPLALAATGLTVEP